MGPVVITPSPFAVMGARLLDMGYSVIPIIPGEKRPGEVRNKVWRGMNDWQRFCERRATSFEMMIWNGFQDAGVCVALGPASGWLVAIDLDYGSPELRAAIEALLPPSPVRKKGAKGYTAFYRGSQAIQARVFRINNQSVCEVLARGRQTVLPPTIHPDGMPYEWITIQTLEDTPVADLPTLPDDIVQQIAVVLVQFGYHEKPETTAPAAVSIGPLPSDFDGEDTIWGEVNRAALAHLDAWVPALGLPKCRKSAPNHYEAVAHWRPSNSGRPLSERKPNLGIDGRGIRDFGDDRGYSPLTLIMSACGCTLDEAYAWLRDLVLPKQTTITLQPRAAELPPHDPETGEILEDPPEVQTPVPEDVEPIPVEVVKPAPVDFENLTHIPGLLGDMVDWIEGTARKPSRILALGVSIAALGTILGRRFASPTNLRTNFYVITLAGSAYGKGHPMKATKALFEAAGMLNFLGGSKIRSDAGLRRAIEQKGTLLYLIDEIGEPLATWLGKTKSGHHLTAVRSMLLEFFSNADSIYQGDDYHEGQTPPIYNPNLSFYGTTTPEDFWRALQGSNVADGFLPRFLVFPLNGKRPQEVEPPLPPDPPGELIERLQNIIMPVRKGNMTGLVHVPGTAKVQAYPVPWGEGALDLWRDMGQQQDDAVDRADPAERSILARRNEHAQKLALIRAVGQDPQQPMIQSVDLEWGLAVVNASIEASLREAKDMIADNQFQADYLRILKLVGEAGPKGMTRRELLKGLKGCIERRKVEDIIAMLKEGGEVDEAPFKSTRGPPRVALVRREYP